MLVVFTKSTSHGRCTVGTKYKCIFNINRTSILSTIETAIQTFHVYGYEDISYHRDELQEQKKFLQRIPSLLLSDKEDHDTGWYYLGTFVYDISKSILGTKGLVNFPILKHSSQDPNIPPLRILLLQINPIIPGVTTDATTAKYLYSCMYRFRVHGEPSLASY